MSLIHYHNRNKLQQQDPTWLTQLLAEVDIVQQQAAINDRIIFNY